MERVLKAPLLALRGLSPPPLERLGREDVKERQPELPRQGWARLQPGASQRPGRPPAPGAWAASLSRQPLTVWLRASFAGTDGPEETQQGTGPMGRLHKRPHSRDRRPGQTATTREGLG